MHLRDQWKQRLAQRYRRQIANYGVPFRGQALNRYRIAQGRPLTSIRQVRRRENRQA
jgi:hypothetical protein